MIERFPYFSILYIINALSRQSSLIVQDQAYNVPALSNDPLYTWYRIGQMARKKLEVDRFETSLAIAESSENASDAMEVDRDLSLRDLIQSEVIEKEAPVNEPIVVVERVEVPVIQTVYIDRIVKSSNITEISRFKKVSVFYDEKPKVDAAVLYPEDELTEFSVWLRAKSGHGLKAQVGGEISEDKAAPIIEKSFNAHPDSVSDHLPEKEESVRLEATIEEIAPDKYGKKAKKKKSPKVKKKQLVDELVSQSIIDHEFLISEPFAQLLYQQGYKEKAVKVYQKLMTKFPEKNNTFALLIDKINNERK